LSDITDPTSGSSHVAETTNRHGDGLSGKLLPELQRLAASLGMTGTARMRKSDLIAEIQQRQADGAARSRSTVPAAESRDEVRAEVRQETSGAPAAGEAGAPGRATRPAGPPGGVSGAGAPGGDASAARGSGGSGSGTHVSGDGVPVSGDGVPAAMATAERTPAERAPAGRAGTRTGRQPEAAAAGSGAVATTGATAGAAVAAQDSVARPRGDAGGPADSGARGRADIGRNGAAPDSGGRADSAARDTGTRGDGGEARGEGRVRGDDRSGRPEGRGVEGRGGEGRGGSRNGRGDDDDGGGRRGRRNRYRDRRRGRGERGASAGEGEPQVSEDDVLVPVAGIVDVLDNYAFVRTSGYLAGSNDVYVSMAQVRKYGLRRGDAVTGVVRADREGEGRRDKYNPLVRLDTINGMDPEEARRRPEFYKLTPLYPQERLRLETEPHLLTTRVIDLIMPIGKGSRALIVSPPRAGKTTVMQNIANAITTNNPECHLMVVLVDERPEEVTDMQRSVKGEVISSTFDRPPTDHTTVSELAIERAKRLVELGLDVVVLLDSITRLGRAYNNATPATGRIMSGGIDSTALYPPKRFLGAARNIENGGSLTIMATALVETGSVMDTVIFEEFKATGNAELKLDRKIADRRVFPAIDIHPSGTRKEELLLAPDELGIVYKLRKVLHSLESQAALDLLLDKLKENKTNVEFLMQIAKTTPGE
jgi:transcription termination factor Rho